MRMCLVLVGMVLVGLVWYRSGLVGQVWLVRLGRFGSVGFVLFVLFCFALV